jgi:hypothetical protein
VARRYRERPRVYEQSGRRNENIPEEMRSIDESWRIMSEEMTNARHSAHVRFSDDSEPKQDSEPNDPELFAVGGGPLRIISRPNGESSMERHPTGPF